MAGVSMNGIKARIKSVQSTMQITKAMELVATSKLRRAKERAEKSRPYLDILKKAINDCIHISENGASVWSKEGNPGKTLYVVIAGDRGLAGGYNANILRLADSLAKDCEAVYMPIGKKAVESYRRRGKEIYTSEYEYASDVSVGDALSLGEAVCKSFAAGEFSKIVIVYTKFVSIMNQIPVQEQLLPLTSGDAAHAPHPAIESDPEELLESIVPDYVGGVIWAAVCSALAAECAARRTAMNAANKNASDMIDDLMLKYNRARQSVITQEITEIVSGAEAL